MKKYLLLCFLIVTVSSCRTPERAISDLAINLPVHATLDLTAVKDDKVPVTIDPGRFTESTVIYRIPKVIPGDYSVSDFGSFIEDVVAVDYQGNPLEIERQDTNTWEIADATNLDKITYYVNDTYDIERVTENFPFSPSGTNIEPDNYVLNLHGFVGYFEQLKKNPYRLDVVAPADFKRSSALKRRGETTSEDGMVITTRYEAERYFDITDNPMMYGHLDVEEFQVGDITIVLSLYSPNKVHTALDLKNTVYTMMQAQKAYLGNIDNTRRYDIYLYLSDGSDNSPRGFGALEHHTSTVVVLRENSSRESLADAMIEVVSHEFFHILTPLNVHSEEIHYFDYNDPNYSKHLWMYEGVTEYFAQHFQIYEGLVDEEEFYRKMVRKISISKRLDDTMSFTEMSQNIIDAPYASNFYNVYMKGALIGMCIDILLREESQGQKGLLSLMQELSKKYGRTQPFDDDTIIDEITAMTYPSIGEFFKTHVEGTVPIDYESFFNKVGLRLVGWTLKPVDNPTKSQLDLRNAWLKGQEYE
jgi:predicted metalloprotease with PDZ domain